MIMIILMLTAGTIVFAVYIVIYIQQAILSCILFFNPKDQHLGTIV